MQNILTIVVPFTATWALPYGPAVVNGILENHGYKTTAWDLSLDLINHFKEDPDFVTFSQMLSIGGYHQTVASTQMVKKVLTWTKSVARQKIKEHTPDIILFSVFSSQSLEFVVPLSTIIRDLAPDAYVVIGGRGLDNTERLTNTIYGSYYAKYLPVNCVYLGDAENDLIKVIESKYQGYYRAPAVNSVQLENTPPACWNGIDFTLYQGYNEKNLRVPITASKGCVRQCTFCDVAGSWPKYVFRKGADVGREMIDIYHKYGINKIEFTDNLVNGSISNFREMNTVIASELPNTLDYYGYAICRPKKEMPETDFELAKIAGASMFKVGIESGSEKVRNDIKKKFSNSDIDWFTINCAKQNIKQVWLMFCGYPTETEEDFQETLQLLKEYQTFAKQGLISVFLSLPMMLTSNSGFMLNYAEEYGLEHNRYDNWSDFFWTSNKYPDNTFEVRVNRWHRFIEKIKEYGYYNSAMQRQDEKLIELNGLEKIYKERYVTKTNTIVESTIQFSKNTHI